ncbi:LysR family transcriptional regulator [Photobacterium sp. SDRW27]|uniref:LysR family transcriptional regulator n=1 Tax=Photobacterium obscurum TaxID=2829490 RepID=UPI002243D51F|nr:LysR family transcriptional regulator [Photobacterium obscurum]MCW8328701.1 LysR family transcriptional regulator [Photobacterium obscurum]
MKANMDDLYLFVLTVRHGGISAAAKAYSLQRSKVSRRLQELEKSLGCQLLIRTTRHIELTDNGRLLYENISQPLTTVNQAVNLLENQQKELQGVLRMAIPAALITSSMFASLIDQYSASFTKVSLDIVHCQDSVDLKRDNIDLQLLPSTCKVVNEDYVQQTLLPFPCCLVASPAYIAAKGTPNRLDDLYDHKILVSRYNSTALSDGLTIGLCSDDLRLVQHMAKSGHGVALLPVILVRDALASGELLPVLTNESFPEIKLTLIYPSKAYLPEKTRAMVKLLRDTFVSRK